MKSLTFWAQDLEDRKPSYIYKNGKELDPIKDKDEREKFVRDVSEIVRNYLHTKIGKNNAILYHSETEFVIEIHSDQRDDIGRIAPITCFGKVPQRKDEEWEKWIDEFFNELNSFSVKIGRSIDDSRVAALKVLTDFKKKRQIQLLATVILFILAVLSALIGIVFIPRL